MASWITHTMLIDKLLEKGINLEKKEFCIGNIAPDCNIENEDWTQFVPSRETTHWMKGKSKLTSDYEGFYEQYINGKEITSKESSFLFGYYSHLITDVEFQKFMRSDKRVQDTFKRIKSNEEMYRKIEGYPEDLDTLKKVFGKSNVFNDIAILDNNYIIEKPNSLYNTALRKTDDFPDYLEFFPKGAIVRKIKIMAFEVESYIQEKELLFFPKKEFEEFVNNTSDIVYKLLVNKLNSSLPVNINIK